MTGKEIENKITGFIWAASALGLLVSCIWFVWDYDGWFYKGVADKWMFTFLFLFIFVAAFRGIRQ